MTKYFRNLFPQKELTLTERALKRFEEHKPVSKSVKGMFANETSKSYEERFEKARQKVCEVA